MSVTATGAPLVLGRTGRHYARRFSGGITPALAHAIRHQGAGAWFAHQLDWARVSDTPGAAVGGWFPSLGRTPAQLFSRQQSNVQGAWEVMADLSRWTVARRVYSNRQVLEQMVDFWSNLLHVPLMHDTAMFWRVDYDRMIRRYALTSFAALLQNAITHPAMGLFLDNASSTKAAPNENLGRELLELHTVGLHYTEADVKSSSRILTGYRADVWWPSFRSSYSPADHWTGPVKVLGFSHPNGTPDGRAATAAYLSYLAHHPLTARRIAQRLCVRFVSDTPSAALVSTVARAYLTHGTAIRPTLQALVGHPEFLASYGRKVRTPIDDYVATVRALGIRMGAPRTDDSFANAMYWQYRDLGQAPYEWPAPNGFPQENAAWTSAGRLLTSVSLHRELAAHWWPTKDATVLSSTALLPTLPTTLQHVIDHVSQRVLGQSAGTDVSLGIAQLLGMSLLHQVTADDARQYWFVIGLVSSLLDSPIHLHR